MVSFLSVAGRFFENLQRWAKTGFYSTLLKKTYKIELALPMDMTAAWICCQMGNGIFNTELFCHVCDCTQIDQLSSALREQTVTGGHEHSAGPLSLEAIREGGHVDGGCKQQYATTVTFLKCF